MTLAQLVDSSYRQARISGWQDDGPIPIPTMIALIHSEASEALESFRNDEPLLWSSPSGKPEGVAAEFADILIRIGHYCGQLGIDLEEAVLSKMEYNAKRPHRHGGKQC